MASHVARFVSPFGRNPFSVETPEQQGQFAANICRLESHVAVFHLKMTGCKDTVAVLGCGCVCPVRYKPSENPPIFQNEFVENTKNRFVETGKSFFSAG